MKRVKAGAQVRDIDGRRWNVREVRTTQHGFDLLLGIPEQSCPKGGPPQVIATRDLLAYWESDRQSQSGFTFDLPASRSTLKRLRRRLGFHSVRDRRDSWKGRLRDLRNLPVQELAQLYKASVDSVSHWRFELIGRKARPAGWWHSPEVLEILQAADLTLKEKGRQLGISVSQVHRLQAKALEFVKEREKIAAAQKPLVMTAR